MHKKYHEEIIPLLRKKFQFKEPVGGWLRKGICPDCKKESVYTNYEDPWTLQCERQNKCGSEFHVKDLFPEIFDTWSNRFERSAEKPNAAADAYMEMGRGFDINKIKNWYTQETYVDRKKNISSATVRFQMPKGASEAVGFWERIIDNPSKFEGKGHFNYGYKYQGLWWQCPDQTIEDLAKSKQIWIAEGIFNAIALRQAGLTAVSAMSTNNNPDKMIGDLRAKVAELSIQMPQLVFAFDTGAAGEKATLKYVDYWRSKGIDAIAALPDYGFNNADWNDLFRDDKLKQHDIERYLWNGQVLLAPTPTEKAALIYERKKFAGGFEFNFENRTYWAKFDEAKITEIEEKDKVKRAVAIRAAGEITEIASCTFDFLYFQRDLATEESYYYLNIKLPSRFKNRNFSIPATFSGAQISKAATFKDRLLSVAAGAQFTGTTQMLERIVRHQTLDLKTVQTLDFWGYSRQHEAYIFRDLAVFRGRVIKANDEKYFDLGKNQLKLRGEDNLLKFEYDPDVFKTNWLKPFWVAFRAKGMVCMAFWVMSFFAEQIRKSEKSLGFLEVTGEAGSGKSTVIQFLWKLSGRSHIEDYEGFDPAKATPAALSRNFNRVANLPVVLLEGDRNQDTSHAKKFDFNELKALFNGGTFRPRAVKNSGNETIEPPFKGSIIIEQNHPVVCDDTAIPSRIMPVIFDKKGRSDVTGRAAKMIEKWPQENVSGTIIHIIQKEEEYLKAFLGNIKNYEDSFRGIIKEQRILKNHAQLHSGLDALKIFFPDLTEDIFEECHEYINQMAKNRESTLEGDHPVVAKFWDYFENLQAYEPEIIGDVVPEKWPVNLHRRPSDYIAIHLPAFEAAARKAGLAPDPIDTMKKYLKESKSRKFIEIKTVNTRMNKHLNCWVFEQKKGD